MSSDFFADDELSQLREHGIVLFAERVIFDARPPIPFEQIATVQALCAGPIPPELVALWQQTAGGRIDYDLHLRMNGNEEAVSWSELFWNGHAVRYRLRQAHDRRCRAACQCLRADIRWLGGHQYARLHLGLEITGAR